MSERKFTPTKWRVVGAEFPEEPYDGARDGEDVVLYAVAAPGMCIWHGHASMIDAAPDMFEQLAELRHYIASDKLRFSENANAQHRQIIDRIDSALSKARGEPQ